MRLKTLRAKEGVIEQLERNLLRRNLTRRPYTPLEFSLQD